MKTFLRNFLFFSVINFSLQTDYCFSQQTIIVPSTGTEFWLGFLTNYEPGEPGERLDIFITSNVSTTGTVSIPAQGYSQNFIVTANVTTTVTIPNNIAETISTEITDNKGILIQTEDTVSVYAINFDNYTADGTLVLPYGSLGTDYRVTSYVGLSGYTYNSEFLIVATQDSTQIEIIPSANTAGGKIAGQTYIINLNEGQCYRVESAASTDELTGSVIRASTQSGSCKPFAVFTGVECVNIPVGCYACDHIYEQEYPTNMWGKNYMLVPFTPMVNYTYKVLADTNATTFSINGGPPQTLNAGQFYEANNVSVPVLISSDKKISVTQFMQGGGCDPSAQGDPAQLFLNPNDQFLKKVVFSTVTSTAITQHTVNVIMKKNYISQLKLDGVTVNPSSFLPFNPDTNYSYAQLSLTQGSHTLEADSGFSAYAYGIGGYETYAYGLGAFREVTIIPTDTVYCSDTVVVLTPPEILNSPQWTLLSNPDSVISTNQSITVTPDNQIYVVTGFTQQSGCAVTYKFSIESPAPPSLSISQSADTICRFDNVLLTASASPYSPDYIYNWAPAAGLSNSSVPNPTASPMLSSWYRCTVSTPSGCATKTDSIFIAVLPGNISNSQITTDKTSFCVGDSAQLNLSYESFIFQDSINPNYNPALWSVITGGIVSDTCGAVSGKALYFYSSGNRIAATLSLNVLNGGTIYFSLKIANGTAPCEDADAGEDVVLEYSTDNGMSWTVFATYAENQYPDFTSLSIAIPSAAQTSSTRFRWRQLANSGINQDNWSLDNIFISANGGAQYPFSWSPTEGLSDTTITNPLASPDSFIVYHTIITDTSTSCQYRDSIEISVGPLFAVLMQDTITNCNTQGIEISAMPSIAGNYSFSWSPSNSLSNSNISNPVSTATSTTGYFVTVTSDLGCSVQDSITVFVPAVLSFFATPPADTICAGQQVQLNTIFQKDCGVNGSSCGTPVDTAQAGTTSTTTSANNATLYNGSSLSARFQLLFTKAELNAAGIAQPSTVSEIGFRIGTIAGSNIYQNFTIKMGCTNLTALTTSYVPGLSTVFTPKNVVLSATVNYYLFNNTFDWDGNSNIIIEVCFNNSVVSANSSNYYSTTSFNCFLATSSSSACNTLTGILSMNKPNTYFKHCSASASGIDLQWSPSVGLSNDTIPNPVATPSSSIMYFVTGNDTATGCNFSDSVFIQVDSTKILNLGNDTSFCSGQIILNAGSGFNSYLWNDGSTDSSKTISSSGIYWVETTNSCGIQRDSIQIYINGNPVNQQLAICDGDSVFLQGNYQTTSGTYYDSLQAMNGCDSVIITALTVNQSTVSNQQLVIYNGDSVFVGGNWQTAPGTYYDTLQTMNSCDSVIITALSFYCPEYTVSSIPFGFTDSVNIGTAPFPNVDDIWSDTVSLPFSFTFFGNNYNQLVLGANGIISFDTSYANDYCNWSFASSCPSNSLPLNAIFGAYHDVDVSICGAANYIISGAAPYRRFAFSFDQVCQYNCSTLKTTQQIVLYETTNIIDVFIKDKPTCISWNNGNALIGIQNSNGTIGLTPPGRNTGSWAASNEGWRFAPPSAAVVQVSETICSGDSIFVGENWQTSSGTYYDTLQNMNGCDSIVETTLSVNDSPVLSITSTPDSGNASGTATAEANGGTSPYTYLWSNGDTTSSVIGLMSSVYFVTVTDANGCEVIDSMFVGNNCLPSNPTMLFCDSAININLTSSGYSGANPLTATGSCGQCCFAGSDLDCDGQQDVSFSVESSQWYAYCNNTGATQTISVNVNEPSNGDSCNIQGAIWIGAMLDSTTLNCNSSGYQQYGSTPDGSADGFAFDSITISDGQCVFIMVDGYAGAQCSGIEVTANCVPSLISLAENKNSQIFIYPNPTKGKLRIDFMSGQKISEIQIEIVSLSGQKIIERKFSKISESQFKTELEVSGISSGIYFLRVITPKETFIKKLVIQ